MHETEVSSFTEGVVSGPICSACAGRPDDLHWSEPLLSLLTAPQKGVQPHFVFPQRLEHKWKSLYEADFNGAAQDTAATQLQLCAAALAGSWKELYRCRLEQDREVRNVL